MKTPKELRDWAAAKKSEGSYGTKRKYARTVDEAHELADAAEAYQAIRIFQTKQQIEIEAKYARLKILLWLIAAFAVISLLTSCNPLTNFQ